jgi:hypothetical protein
MQRLRADSGITGSALSFAASHGGAAFAPGGPDDELLRFVIEVKGYRDEDAKAKKDTILGVDVRGRSWTRKVNYRTSHQIQAYADRLPGARLADVAGNIGDRGGTVTTLAVPPPGGFTAPVAPPTTLPQHVPGTTGSSRTGCHRSGAARSSRGCAGLSAPPSCVRRARPVRNSRVRRPGVFSARGIHRMTPRHGRRLRLLILWSSLALSISTLATADESLDAALGSAVGGGLGAFLGNELAGREGAILGGAAGAATGAALATRDQQDERRRIYRQPSARRYAPGRGGCPPGLAKQGRCR